MQLLERTFEQDIYLDEERIDWQLLSVFTQALEDD
jgi:hypothetical protein